jgi:hypothetical protein
MLKRAADLLLSGALAARWQPALTLAVAADAAAVSAAAVMSAPWAGRTSEVILAPHTASAVMAAGQSGAHGRTPP